MRRFSAMNQERDTIKKQHLGNNNIQRESNNMTADMEDPV